MYNMQSADQFTVISQLNIKQISRICWSIHIIRWSADEFADQLMEVI